MKWFVFSMLLLVAGPSFGGSYDSGNSLYTMLQNCEKDAGVACAYTLGYVAGVSDTLAAPSLDVSICAPLDVTRQQLNDVVHLWLKNNPGKRSYAATSIVRVAMQETWPCTEESP